MSMTKKMQEAGIPVAPQAQKKAPTPAPAPTAGAAGDVASGKTAAKAKSAAFRAKGDAIRQGMTDEQKAAEGAKSDTVAFVACLGNPAVTRSRKVGNDYVNSVQIVGYKFKALEDTTVPVAKFKAEPKNILDVDITQETRPVKAGEIVSLNVVESAMFISRPEYAGFFSGEGQTVFVSAVSSKDSKDPTPCLKRQGGSIKENIEMIADMIGAVNGEGGKAQVKDEFAADFAVLFNKRTTKRASGAGKNNSAGESIKSTAAAFRALYGVQ